MNCTESSLNFASSLDTYIHTTVYHNDLFRVRRTSQSLARSLAALQSTVDTHLAQDVTASFCRLQQDLAAEQEGAGTMLTPTPYAPDRAAYSEVVSSTMDQYTTNLINRLTEDLSFWMASLYSIRLRQFARTIPSAQRPVLTKGDADKLGFYIAAWCQERNQPLLPPPLPAHWKTTAAAAHILHIKDEADVDLLSLVNCTKYEQHVNQLKSALNRLYKEVHNLLTATALRHSIQQSVTVCKHIMQEHFPEHPDFPVLGMVEDGMVDRWVVWSSFRELLDVHRDSFDELQQISDTHGFKFTVRRPQEYNPATNAQDRDTMADHYDSYSDPSWCSATYTRRYRSGVWRRSFCDNQVATVFFENDTIGNRACLNTIRASMEQRGFAYNICLHFQHFNETQIDLADIMQVVPPGVLVKYQDYRNLHEGVDGSLSRTLHPVRQQGISDESSDAIGRLVHRAAIAISHQYLQAVQEHGDTDETRAMFQQTFRPELAHLVRLQRLFNLVPDPSFTKKHIKIELQTIKKLLKKEGLHQYANQDAWANVFNFNRIKNVRDMTIPGHLYTDGFSVSVPFKKFSVSSISPESRKLRSHNHKYSLTTTTLSLLLSLKTSGHGNLTSCTCGLLILVFPSVYVTSDGLDNVYELAAEQDVAGVNED